MKSFSAAAVTVVLLLAQAPLSALAQQSTTPQQGSQHSSPPRSSHPGRTMLLPKPEALPAITAPSRSPRKRRRKSLLRSPPAEPTVKNPPGLQNFSLHVDVPVVTVDVGVLLEKTHQFVPNLKQENFRIYEDGKQQDIATFQQIKAPITAVLLVEFASTSYYFVYDMRNAAYNFAEQLRPDDYIAVMTYDMHTNILTDFTQDKRVVMNSLNSLTIPTWRETNMFDALYQTLDRLTRVEGRKYIILIGSGHRHLLQDQP